MLVALGRGSGAVMRPDSFADFVSHSINRLFVYLTYFLISLYFRPYLITSLLVYFLTYPSTSFRIYPFRVRAVGRRIRPNVAILFWGFILCCSMFCYACMFASVVFDLVFQY